MAISLKKTDPKNVIDFVVKSFGELEVTPILKIRSCLTLREREYLRYLMLSKPFDAQIKAFALVLIDCIGFIDEDEKPLKIIREKDPITELEFAHLSIVEVFPDSIILEVANYIWENMFLKTDEKKN